MLTSSAQVQYGKRIQRKGSLVVVLVFVVVVLVFVVVVLV